MGRFTKRDDLREIWMDPHVMASDLLPKLKRCASLVGCVVTVNFNGTARTLVFSPAAFKVLAAARMRRLSAALKVRRVGLAQPSGSQVVLFAIGQSVVPHGV